MLKDRLGADLDQTVRRLFPFVSRIRLKPDTLTALGVAVSVLAGVAFGSAELLLAGLLMMVAGFFDLIDGVVARNQGNASRGGAFLDSTMDRVSDLAIFAGLGVLMTSRGSVAGTLLVFWALAGSVMTSYVRARAEAEIEELRAGYMERAERCVVLILGALTGWIQVALLVVALGSTLTTVQRIWIARRLLRAVDQSGHEEKGAGARSRRDRAASR